MKKIKITFIVMNVIAFMFSVAIMCIAFEHNPMGEFYEYVEGPGVNGLRQGAVQWKNLLVLGCLAYLETVFILGIIVLLANLLQKICSKRAKK